MDIILFSRRVLQGQRDKGNLLRFGRLKQSPGVTIGASIIAARNRADHIANK